MSQTPTAVTLVVETFGDQFTSIAARHAESIRETGDLCLPLTHFQMAAEFYSVCRVMLETTPVSQVDAVETVLDHCIDWVRLSKSYLRIAVETNS
jgi:hypothetical protein